MTTQKTLKRRVRARAAKTGESYTAARSQLLRKADAPAVDSMELAGVSDEAMIRGTGKPLGEWLPLLDGWGATERKHAEIARWLVAEHGVPGWWAQSVTVAYERARGIRTLHQDPTGFSISVSKTISASPERVSEALTDDSLRAAWLPDAPIRLRRSNPGRSARFDWDEPKSLVGVMLFAKGEAKTQVGLAHEKLPDADAADRLKRMWRGRLADLKALLEGT
jgi:Domain of unknown function (DUF4287)